MRKRKDGGLSLTTITKMLENVKTPRTFCDLNKISTPIYKKSFLKYLDYCVSKDLVSKRMVSYSDYHETISHSKFHNHNHSIEPYRPLYLLSDKGRDFLEMIQ